MAGAPDEVDYEEVAALVMEGARRLVAGGGSRGGAGPAGAEVLRELVGRGGCAVPSELARGLGCSRARITRIIDGLEGRGLVDRSADPADRRRVVVRVTEEGRRAASRGAGNAVSGLADALSRLGERDASELARIIGRARKLTSAR